MKTKTTKKRGGGAGAPPGDDYFALVRRFPLRPIRSREEYDQAAQLLIELRTRENREGLRAGESDYTDMLGRMVREYDEEHSSLLKELRAKGKPSPLELLKMLMEEHQMNTIGLGKLLGSGSGQASLILNGKRELSKANIRTLAEYFKISPAALL